MSMPSFPKNGANMTREQALTMIIASVAMEECALSRIIDAEGDKLRYVLDQCCCGCSEIPETVLAANESVTRLLEVVARNQALLRGKLSLALDANGKCPPDPPCPPPEPPHPPCPSPCPPHPPCPPPCPPKPPCPPCPEPVQKSFMQLGLSGCGYLWKNERLIPWEYLDGRGNAVRWEGESPALVDLEPGRAYFVSCIFNIRDFLPTEASGSICLESAGTSREPPSLCFSIRCAGGEPVTLQYSALLLPESASAISFRLRSRTPLCVEQAELSIVEI